jgi:uncharacterized protein (DUF1697 family)
MIRFAAFLRGINVSGQKLIKMDALKASLDKTSLENVKTYIQSGNLVFDSNLTDCSSIENLISETIENNFGFYCDVVVRKLSDLQQLINEPDYQKLRVDPECKFYITMIKNGPFSFSELPAISLHKDVEVVWGNGKDFLSKVYLHKGNYGTPNVFLEKMSGSPATTRNANTLEKVISL